MITDEQIGRLEFLLQGLKLLQLNDESARNVEAVRAALEDARKYRWCAWNITGITRTELLGDERMIIRQEFGLCHSLDAYVTKAMEENQ
jgi:hypothetical protein